MDQFNRLNIKYTPAEIKNNLIDTYGTNQDNKTYRDQDVVADYELATKLLDHLKVIQDFRDRVSAIDYLIEGANKLAGNPQYYTTKEDLIRDITKLGGSTNVVDFDLFKKAVDLVIKGYQDMALISMTGVAND